MIASVPPHDAEAEAAVLGALLLGPGIADQAEAYAALERGSFYDPKHAAIFEACAALYREQAPVDELSVANRLREAGEHDKTGGLPALSALVEATPSGANLPHYVEIVRGLWKRRRLMLAARDALTRAANLGQPVDEVLDQVGEGISALLTDKASGAPKTFAELVRRESDLLLKESQAPGHGLGVPTGFYDLDERLGGMQPGESIVVAGRPGMGKTAYALAVATHAALKAGAPTLFVSLEMNDRQIVQRALAGMARIDGQALRQPKKLRSGDWPRLAAAVGKLDSPKLAVLDTPGLTVLDIRAHARLMKARQGLALVLVDYIGLLRPVHREQVREREVAAISLALKNLAKELEAPVMCLSQLNRAIEYRTADQRRPRLSDLRESGALEQDADAVLFIHREGYYDEAAPQDVAEIIIAKQRNGPTGIVRVGWDARCVRFFNPSERDEQTPAADWHEPVAQEELI